MKSTEINEQEYVPVAKFYAEKSVFVTGATGFLGKVLVEKLLSSCPDIHKIYILIREKSNEKVSERMKKLCQNLVFTRIRNERPNDLHKIVPIIGDITASELGLHINDEEKLINEVSVVFHSAANVKFDEPLTTALDINLEGTRKILNLCKRMKKIKILIHLSTAYSHSDREVIDEVIYPPPRKLSDVYEFVQQYGDNKEMTANILSGRPNTYTFTKALTENLIAETHCDFPAVIIRPSIVIPSVNEPLRGWVDNWYGANAMLTTIAKVFVVLSLARIITYSILFQWITFQILLYCRLPDCTGKFSRGVTVLNSCTGDVNPITMEEIKILYSKESIRNGFNDLPFPGTLLITNKMWLVQTVTIIIKSIAYIIDLPLRIAGKNPRFVRIQRKSDYVMNALSYFTSHSWLIKGERAFNLYNTLDAHDRQLFPCDPNNIDWELYIPIYFQGVKQYLIEGKCK